MAHPRIQPGGELVAAGPAVMVVLVCRSVGVLGGDSPWDVNLGVWSGEVEERSEESSDSAVRCGEVSCSARGRVG